MDATEIGTRIYVTAADSKYNLGANFNIFPDNRSDIYKTVRTLNGFAENFRQTINEVGTSILHVGHKYGFDSVGIVNSNNNYWIPEVEDKEIDISRIKSEVVKAVKGLKSPFSSGRVDVTCSGYKFEIHIHNYHFHGNITGDGNQFGDTYNY